MPEESKKTGKVTITDVARESGVSPATVSLVLRNKPGVSARTRQRVFDTAQAMGYVLRPAMRAAQVSREVRTVAVIAKVSSFEIVTDNVFYAPVLASIEAECRRHQFNLLLNNVPVTDENKPLDMPRLLEDEQVDGCLLIGVHLDKPFVERLRELQMPTVLVDAYSDEGAFDAVLSDNFSGAFQATEHLIEAGHSAIAVAGSEPDSFPSIRERREGYEAAMAKHGLEPIFADSHLSSRAAAPVLETLLLERSDVSAVFACNDDVAITTMKVARDLGRVLPKSLSIVGFDNINLAQHMVPALTTMRVDKMGMGRLAMQLLLNRLDHPEAGAVQAVIQPHLIQRESVTSAE